jgi:hypothetical protein
VRGPRSLPDEVESRGDSHPLSKATTSLHLSLFPLLGGVPVILPCRAPTTVHVNIECHRILLKSLRRTDACYYSVWGASRSSKPDAPADRVRARRPWHTCSRPVAASVYEPRHALPLARLCSDYRNKSVVADPHSRSKNSGGSFFQTVDLCGMREKSTGRSER